MTTGRAYGYFAFDGMAGELVREMELARQGGYDKLRFTVLEDKVTGFSDPMLSRLSPRIAELAESTNVSGSVPGDQQEKLRKLRPVRASSLRYIVKAVQPDMITPFQGDQNGDEPGEQALYGANSTTAGMLRDILNSVGYKSPSGISKNAVFYLNGRGRAQESY